MLYPICRFPPPGPVRLVPRFRQYYQQTPTSRTPSGLASLPSPRRTRRLSLFAPAGRDTFLPAWTFSSATPAPLLQRERTRPPRFLKNPCQHAPLFDPGGPFATCHGATNDAAFRSGNDVGSTHSFISGLNHAACWPPVYTSQPGSPPNHATLGSGGWLILAGSGLAPAGFQQEVSILVLSFTQISSSSRLGLAYFPRQRLRPDPGKRQTGSGNHP